MRVKTGRFKKSLREPLLLRRQEPASPKLIGNVFYGIVNKSSFTRFGEIDLSVLIESDVFIVNLMHWNDDIKDTDEIIRLIMCNPNDFRKGKKPTQQAIDTVMNSPSTLRTTKGRLIVAAQQDHRGRHRILCTESIPA